MHSVFSTDIKCSVQNVCSAFTFDQLSTGPVEKDKTHIGQCKMPSSKKITREGTLRQVFICLNVQNTIPPQTYSHSKGGGGES